MTMNGSRSGTSLIDTEDMYQTHGGHSVRASQDSSSWRSPPTGSGSVASRTASRTATSVTGTELTYASCVAERSMSSDVGRSGWARIRAHSPDGPVGYGRASPPPPMRPDGDARRDIETDVASCWNNDDDSDEEGERGRNSDDDSDGDNTVI
jgi:hypothetical protein